MNMSNYSTAIGSTSMSGGHMTGTSILGGAGGTGSTVTWAPTPTQQKGTEIDRIMAKIEQARLSLVNVCVLLLNSDSKFSFF